MASFALFGVVLGLVDAPFLDTLARIQRRLHAVEAKTMTRENGAGPGGRVFRVVVAVVITLALEAVTWPLTWPWCAVGRFLAVSGAV